MSCGIFVFFQDRLKRGEFLNGNNLSCVLYEIKLLNFSCNYQNQPACRRHLKFKTFSTTKLDTLKNYFLNYLSTN